MILDLTGSVVCKELGGTEVFSIISTLSLLGSEV